MYPHSLVPFAVWDRSLLRTLLSRLDIKVMLLALAPMMESLPGSSHESGNERLTDMSVMPEIVIYSSAHIGS